MSFARGEMQGKAWPRNSGWRAASMTMSFFHGERRAAWTCARCCHLRRPAFSALWFGAGHVGHPSTSQRLGWSGLSSRACVMQLGCGALVRSRWCCHAGSEVRLHGTWTACMQRNGSAHETVGPKGRRTPLTNTGPVVETGQSPQGDEDMSVTEEFGRHVDQGVRLR